MKRLLFGSRNVLWNAKKVLASKASCSTTLRAYLCFERSIFKLWIVTPMIYEVLV